MELKSLPIFGFFPHVRIFPIFYCLGREKTDRRQRRRYLRTASSADREQREDSRWAGGKRKSNKMQGGKALEADAGK